MDRRSFLLVVSFGAVACGSSESNDGRASPDGGGGIAGGADSGADGTASGGGGGGNATLDSAVDAPPSPCTLAEEWDVVDDYFVSTSNHTNAGALFVAADGSLYATGITLSMGMATGFVRVRESGGAFTLVKAEQGIGGDLVVTSSGVLFATGNTQDGSTRTVKRSDDGGETWEVVDSVPLVAGACGTGHLAGSRSGRLYWAGSCDVEGWNVRTSEDEGDTWRDIEEAFTLADGMPARLSSVFIDSNDRVYVSGTAQDESQVAHWIVRRLETSGSFETVDDFTLEEGRSAVAPTLHGGRHLYAAGSAETTDGTHAVVRRADGDGNSWTTVDDFMGESGAAAHATAVHDGGDGAVIVTGHVVDSDGVSQLYTRRSSDDGSTWQAPATYEYVAGKSTSPAGRLVEDAAGHVYGAVRGVDADDHAHMIVRQLACEP